MESKTEICKLCRREVATTWMMLQGADVEACEECAEREAEFIELDYLDSLADEY